MGWREMDKEIKRILTPKICLDCFWFDSYECTNPDKKSCPYYEDVENLKKLED